MMSLNTVIKKYTNIFLRFLQSCTWQWLSGSVCRRVEVFVAHLLIEEESWKVLWRHLHCRCLSGKT